MSNYMQEPWPPFIDICEPATPHPDSNGIVRLGFDDYRRAKACVNALAGVPTEWVEKFSIAGSDNVAQENARLTKQRDELLSALEFIESVYRLNVVATGEPSGTLCAMQQLITKTKGGAA